MCVVVALMLVPMLPLSLFADDQSAGQGPASQQEITKGATDTQPSVQQERDRPAATELGPGTERPMRAPESEGTPDIKSVQEVLLSFDSNDQMRHIGDE
jgi:hypothetical protein